MQYYMPYAADHANREHRGVDRYRGRVDVVRLAGSEQFGCAI